MDDITLYGDTFEECLTNLETVLHRCIELGEIPFYGKSRYCLEACYFQKGG